MLEQVRQLSGQGPAGLPDLKGMILPSLGRAMGLPVKREVPIREMAREDLKALLLDVMKRQYPGNRLEVMGYSFEQIGLLPAGTKLRQEVLKLYQSQVAGFYDPRTHDLALIKGASSLAQGQVLQHELAHALQDQHYPIQKKIDAVQHDEDQALAFQGVIEGQAVVAMTISASTSYGSLLSASSGTDTARLKEMIDSGVIEGLEGLDVDSLLNPGKTLSDSGISASSMFVPANDGPVAAAPAYLRAQLMFPYVEGTQFIEALMKGRSFAEVVRRTLDAPPTSTTQIIHPETYLEAKGPVKVELPGLLELPGWSSIYESTLGELNIRVLLGGRGKGDEGAKGWAGDRLYTLSGLAGQKAVVWMTRWDSQVEAAEFEGELKRRWNRRAGVGLPGSSMGETVYARSGMVDVIQRRGDRVAVLAAVPEDARQALVEAAWDVKGSER